MTLNCCNGKRVVWSDKLSVFYDYLLTLVAHFRTTLGWVERATDPKGSRKKYDRPTTTGWKEAEAKTSFSFFLSFFPQSIDILDHTRHEKRKKEKVRKVEKVKSFFFLLPKKNLRKFLFLFRLCWLSTRNVWKRCQKLLFGVLFGSSHRMLLFMSAWPKMLFFSFFLSPRKSDTFHHHKRLSRVMTLMMTKLIFSRPIFSRRKQPRKWILSLRAEVRKFLSSRESNIQSREEKIFFFFLLLRRHWRSSALPTETDICDLWTLKSISGMMKTPRTFFKVEKSCPKTGHKNVIQYSMGI